MTGNDMSPCLDRLWQQFDLLYAQWLIETEATRDYRVEAAVAPKGEVSYELAHRTGVIGQVFRLRRPLFVHNGSEHPLYDPYDSAVTWELATPLYNGGEMAGVINLEGSGDLELEEKFWRLLGETITECSDLQLPPELPNVTWEVPTIWLQTVPPSVLGDTQTVARWLAEKGKTVLVAGAVKVAACPEYPTLAEMLSRGEPIAAAVRGWSRGVDVLPSGTSDAIQGNRPAPWHKQVEGRYDVVIMTSLDSGFGRTGDSTSP